MCADAAGALSSWLRVGLGVYVRARGRACVRAGMDVAVALGTCLHAWV